MENETQAATKQAAIRKGQGVAMGAAGIVAAAVGLIVLLVAARCLSVEDNSRFTAFWSALYLVFGIVSGVAVETTRAVSAREGRPRDVPSGSLKVMTLGLVFVGLVAILLGTSLPAWRFTLPVLAGRDSWLVCSALLAGVVGYSAQSVLVGALAGIREWNLYATTVLFEAGVRIVAVAIVAACGSGLVGMTWACVVAEYAWVIVAACSKTARNALRHGVDVRGKRFASRVGGAMIGQGASAILLVGFPWLVGMTTERSIYLGAAPLMLAISLTRAPLMVPFSAFYNVGVSYFARQTGAPMRTLLKMVGIVGGVGMVISVVAGIIGPPLLRLIGEHYVVPGMTLAALTLGATCIAIVSLTGILCQSAASYRAYIAGWMLAVGIAVGVLMTPWEITTRVVVALILGPLCGAALHVGLLQLARRNHPTELGDLASK